MPAASDAQVSNADVDFVIVDESAETPPESSADYLDAISHYTESISSCLCNISLEIHDHPELQYKEYHAHQVLTEFLKSQNGWQVTSSAYGIGTAFVAVYDSGKKGPTVSFNAEYGMLDTNPPLCPR